MHYTVNVFFVTTNLFNSPHPPPCCKYTNTSGAENRNLETFRSSSGGKMTVLGFRDLDLDIDSVLPPSGRDQIIFVTRTLFCKKKAALFDAGWYPVQM